jgi:hypothetical protein
MSGRDAQSIVISISRLDSAGLASGMALPIALASD